MKRIREIVGDNAADFARRIGISQPLLHGYLTGRYAPGYEFFMKLAQLEFDVNWVLTGKPASSIGSVKRKRREFGSEKARIVDEISGLVTGLPSGDASIVGRTVRTLAKALSERKD